MANGQLRPVAAQPACSSTTRLRTRYFTSGRVAPHCIIAANSMCHTVGSSPVGPLLAVMCRTNIGYTFYV